MLPVAAIGAIVGLVMLVMAWRGRAIDDHPVCRKCSFDLVGLAALAQCPECGKDLAHAGTVRIGNRKRSRWALGFSLVVLFTSSLVAGAALWGQATKFNWYSIKPTW